MEEDLNEKGKEIWQPELQEEEMMESLEVAFSRRWNQPKQSKEINLGEITDIDEEKWKRTLIGKLHVRRHFDDDDLTKELIRNWNIRGKFDLVKVADGIVSITFSREIDYQFVLENGPWEIHGYIISFKKWSKDLGLEEFDFPLFPIWIQVFGLPLERHSIQNIERIGASLGKLLTVDSVGGAEGKIPYVRVQVLYNVHHPIQKDAIVKLREDKRVQVYFKYERLPLFCHFCGLLGHDYGVCRELKECQRNYHKELTRDDYRKILTFSYMQKAKSFKFGAGIQARHIIEVDPEAEMVIEDQKFIEWQEERKQEDARKKMIMAEGVQFEGQGETLTTVVASQGVLEGFQETNRRVEEEMINVVEDITTPIKDNGNVIEDLMDLSSKKTGVVTDMVEVGSCYGVIDMEISPLTKSNLKRSAQTIPSEQAQQTQSANMSDIPSPP
ncbi:reverse transcriptase, partial [Thalictrum thalictroides]